MPLPTWSTDDVSFPRWYLWPLLCAAWMIPTIVLASAGVPTFAMVWFVGLFGAVAVLWGPWGELRATRRTRRAALVGVAVWAVLVAVVLWRVSPDLS